GGAAMSISSSALEAKSGSRISCCGSAPTPSSASSIVCGLILAPGDLRAAIADFRLRERRFGGVPGSAPPDCSRVSEFAGQQTRRGSMSNRQPQIRAVKFEPVPESTTAAPGAWMLVFGVLYPAAVIGIELVTHMCARAFFDPIPTWGHAAAAAFVPASNLLIWTQLRIPTVRHARGLAFASGA